jgi:hypothetical protein
LDNQKYLSTRMATPGGFETSVDDPDVVAIEDLVGLIHLGVFICYNA